MIRVILTLSVFTLVFISSAFAQAALFAPRSFECKVTKVLNSDYENINDFEFSEYPWLVVDYSDEGFFVHVGAMTYGEEVEEGDIMKRRDENGQVIIENNYEWMPLKVVIDSATRIATVFATVDDPQTTIQPVAEFACDF